MQGTRGKPLLARLTGGRFSGEPFPSSDLPTVERYLRRALWGARMLLVHLPFRMLVFAGDNCCHDTHHRHPSDKSWPNAIYERQRLTRRRQLRPRRDAPL